MQIKRPTIYQIVGQKDVSASQHTVYVCHSFPDKKQMPSVFMVAGASAVVLDAKMKKSVTLPHFLLLFVMKDGAGSHDLSFLIFNFKLAECVQMLTGNI